LGKLLTQLKSLPTSRKKRDFEEKGGDLLPQGNIFLRVGVISFWGRSGEVSATEGVSFRKNKTPRLSACEKSSSAGKGLALSGRLTAPVRESWPEGEGA